MQDTLQFAERSSLVKTRIPVRHKALVHHLEDSQESVLHDANGNQLLVLNESAAVIWLLIDDKRTVEDIAKLIAESIPSSPSSTADEVYDFLIDLEARELLHWR